MDDRLRDGGTQVARSVVPRGIALMIAALLVALHAPASAQTQPPPPDEATAEDFDVARASLDQLNHRLDQAQRALAEADARLAAATSDLNELVGRLGQAEAEHAAAAEEAQRAGESIAEADVELQRIIGEWEDSRALFQNRVAAAYKHGTPWGAALFTESLFEAQDLHEVAVNVRAVQAIMREDLRAMRQARQLALEAADARRRMADLRRAALDKQAAADRARDQVAALVDRQHAVIAEIEEQRAERQRILDAVAADRQQMAALVIRLSEVSARLSGLLEAGLGPQVDLPFDGPAPEWAARLPQPGRQWASAITAAAGRVGLSPQLFASLVWAESYFQPGAVSSAGAIGLSQLMPATARSLGVDPWDPIDNLIGGSRYLRAQLGTFGQVDLGLAAYNAGPNAVERAGRRVPDKVETQMYVLRVLEYWEHILGR